MSTSDNPYHILIAPDKFKGGLSAQNICDILKNEIQEIIPSVIIDTCPLADGGDGSLDILLNYMALNKISCKSVDPLGRSIDSYYLTNNETAYIELANASGIVLLNDTEKNPMRTSSFGTGLQLKDALDKGFKNIYLFLGGSATNDGGIGIIHALGYSIMDRYGNLLEPIGSSLHSISSILEPSKPIGPINLTLCCDVNNPPSGPKGAANIYAKQKGANSEEIKTLETGIINLCTILNPKLLNLKGGGAAGGIAISLTHFLDASMVSGVKLISKLTNLESKIKKVDIVITGEGKLDQQSLEGKVISEVAIICKANNKPLIVVVGSNELADAQLIELGVNKTYSIIKHATNREDAILNSKEYLKIIGQKIATLISSDHYNIVIH